ncbi:MAG: glutathione S-transferase family protein [Alphaproteobacteria bacterium]
MKLYAAPTPSGWKPAIMLEELGLDYEVVPIDIFSGAQHSEEYRKLNPMTKIPVLVDNASGTPVTIYGSAAILLYLAEREGALLPTSQPARARAIEWLMTGASDLAPSSTVLFIGAHVIEADTTAIEAFYENEIRTILGAMELALGAGDYLAGEYSIADIICYAQLASPVVERFDMSAYPRVAAWRARLASRPQVQAGLKVAA